jgi:hypothetical protein
VFYVTTHDVLGKGHGLIHERNSYVPLAPVLDRPKRIV